MRQKLLLWQQHCTIVASMRQNRFIQPSAYRLMSGRNTYTGCYDSTGQKRKCRKLATNYLTNKTTNHDERNQNQLNR